MFYGAFVLAKKGPLAKVWLAAHWDKKLTKAHVFETDVESTVDNIISPQVKMALRTSGHLLLGVVRIYSRKQKYLIHDLGEACAKIKMAFRPGIVDLPADGGVDNADAITLPEIFHDFETAVADLGALDLEAQYTINPSRAAEITIADNIPGDDMFGGEFGDFGDLGLVGGDFGGGMDDIEVPRAKSTTFSDDKDITEKSHLQVGDLTNGTTLQDEPSKRMDDFTLEERLPDGNDFGVDGGFFLEDGFGPGDGGLEDFGGDMPTLSDITLDPNKTAEKEEEEKTQDEQEKETPMEVDLPPPSEDRASEERAPEGEERADTTVVPVQEEGFVLEPLDTTLRGKERVKRKRRLVVDSDKEFPGTQIKAQFQDFKDLLQPKCFPPPTKKAMVWKEMAGCEQLFSRPTAPQLQADLADLITRNYSTVIPGEPPPSVFNLDQDVPTSSGSAGAKDATPPKDKSADREALRGDDVDQAAATDTTLGETTVPEGEITDLPPGPDPAMMMDDMGFGGLGADDGRPFDDLETGEPGDKTVAAGEMEEPTSRVIPDLPDLDDIPSVQSSEEQQSNELSEEFERRRWTKRTQQVLRVLGRNLSGKESLEFSSLTQRCSRKQAASRFYTCLLLAKEGMIDVTQEEPYADIHIQKGPKFTEVF